MLTIIVTLFFVGADVWVFVHRHVEKTHVRCSECNTLIVLDLSHLAE